MRCLRGLWYLVVVPEGLQQRGEQQEVDLLEAMADGVDQAAQRGGASAELSQSSTVDQLPHSCQGPQAATPRLSALVQF